MNSSALDEKLFGYRTDGIVYPFNHVNPVVQAIMIGCVDQRFREACKRKFFQFFQIEKADAYKFGLPGALQMINSSSREVQALALEWINIFYEQRQTRQVAVFAHVGGCAAHHHNDVFDGDTKKQIDFHRVEMEKAIGRINDHFRDPQLQFFAAIAVPVGDEEKSTRFVFPIQGMEMIK